MKKLLLIIAVLLITSGTAFSQFSWGVGGGVGTKAAFDNSLFYYKVGVGVHARGIYDLSETTTLQAGFTYYLPTKISTASVNQMVLNMDFNYNFVSEEDMKVYALGGMNYTGFHVEAGSSEGNSYGAGFHAGLGLRQEHFFVEARYEFKKTIKDIININHDGQIVATFGYIF